MHASAGSAALIAGGDGPSAEAAVPPGPKPRMVAAAATPIASNVMTVSAPLATDLSARNSVIRRMIPKNPAAASVSHIGNDGERQRWSSEEAQAQFMRDVPQRDRKTRSAQASARERLNLRRMLLRTGPFNGEQQWNRYAVKPCTQFIQETSSWLSLATRSKASVELL